MNIKPGNEYRERQTHLINNRKYKSTMSDQLDADRDTVASFPTLNTEPKKNTLLSILVLPFKLYMYATHGLYYFWLSRFIKQKIKDPQFISSVKFSISIFLVPVYYLIVSFIIYLVTKSTLITLIFLFRYRFR